MTFNSGQEGAESAPEEPVKLATLLITDVRLCVCADETLNGHDNVVEMINRLDDGTEVPHDLRFVEKISFVYLSRRVGVTQSEGLVIFEKLLIRQSPI